MSELKLSDLKKLQAGLQATFNKAQAAFTKASAEYQKAKAPLSDFNNEYGRVLELLNTPKRPAAAKAK